MFTKEANTVCSKNKQERLHTFLFRDFFSKKNK